MGQVTIEIPQNVIRTYRVEDSKFSQQLLEELEDFEKKSKSQNIILPRRNSLKKDLKDAVGIWADRDESAAEIARKIRDKNNGKI